LHCLSHIILHGVSHHCSVSSCHSAIRNASTYHVLDIHRGNKFAWAQGKKASVAGA
jgi:hypothetical protein